MFPINFHSHKKLVKRSFIIFIITKKNFVLKISKNFTFEMHKDRQRPEV
jgi:hypothetical protein